MVTAISSRQLHELVYVSMHHTAMDPGQSNLYWNTPFGSKIADVIEVVG